MMETLTLCAITPGGTSVMSCGRDIGDIATKLTSHLVQSKQQVSPVLPPTFTGEAEVSSQQSTVSPPSLGPSLGERTPACRGYLHFFRFLSLLRLQSVLHPIQFGHQHYFPILSCNTALIISQHQSNPNKPTATVCLLVNLISAAFTCIAAPLKK